MKKINSQLNLPKKTSFVVNGKSDIIVSFDAEYLDPVTSQKKTYEFRSWRADSEVKRMWIYANRPIQSLMYIFEFDLPVEYPNQIPNDNIYNKIFNQGKNPKWKFAYRIKHLYKLNEPISISELKAKYGIHPPQKLTYVSKYLQLVKNLKFNITMSKLLAKTYKIDKKLVQKLIKSQCPEYAHLTIRRVKKSRHDNQTFLLGDKMTVRLPSGKDYASQVEKEIFWLPKLKQNLSLPISTPLTKGEPSADYPLSWSINKWIEGDTVNHDNVKDLDQFAVDLAKFLKQLQKIDTSNGPIAGEHNFYRGGNLSIYDKETQTALKNLKQLLPTNKLNDIWQTALGSKWTKENVWVHGDVAPGNLLVKDGKLCGVIDFGILGVGDPACDYVMAWTFFDKKSRKIFFKALGCDKDTWNRARGWALWKALITYNEKNLAKDAKHTINAIMNEG